MQQSEQIDELAKAMAAAAGELRDIEKDAKNNRNRYATLLAVTSATRPILASHGLTVSQWVGGAIAPGERVTVSTQLSHLSGQWMRDRVEAIVEPVKSNSLAQVAGIQISYIRRYAVFAALGLASGDDIDGDLEAGPPPPPAVDLVNIAAMADPRAPEAAAAFVNGRWPDWKTWRKADLEKCAADMPAHVKEAVGALVKRLHSAWPPAPTLKACDGDEERWAETKAAWKADKVATLRALYGVESAKDLHLGHCMGNRGLAWANPAKGGAERVAAAWVRQ